MSAAIKPKLPEKGEKMITIDVAEYCSACADYIKLHNNTRSIVEEILEMIRTKLTEVENAEN